MTDTSPELTSADVAEIWAQPGTRPVTYPIGARWPANADVTEAMRARLGPDQFDVIGAVESVPVGDAILRIGRTLSKTDHSWVQEMHLVLTPDERDQLIADLTALRPTPAVDLHPEPEHTPLVWVWDGDTCNGTVVDLAGFIETAELSGGSAPKVVYAPTVDGQLAPVAYRVERSSYDDNDVATGTVTVTLADGVEVQASYQVDGRA